MQYYMRNLPIQRRLLTCLTFLSFVFFQSNLSAQDYQKAWDALANNDPKTARSYLEKAGKQSATAVDAALTSMLLDTYDGHEIEGGTFFRQAIKNMPDPYPYYFALWNNEGVTGNYGLCPPEQVDLLESLVDDPKCNEMLKASARYHLSVHYLSKGDFKKMNAVTLPIGNVTEWQYTGPFDNVSESGFDKNYPPISQPGPDARFKATNNSDIYWFTPPKTDHDGWEMAGMYISWKTGIIYAQSFVTAPEDMDLRLALGVTSSSTKIWVNDQLLFAELEDRHTDFDLVQVPCKLKKGVNRVLLQLGLPGDQTSNFCLRFLDKNGVLASGLSSSATYAAYPKATGPAPAPIPFFAEEFFRNKVGKEPDNLLNYYLLCETYLRSEKSREGLEIIEKALQKAPDNVLLRFQRLNCLRKLDNRTALTQEIEDIKRLTPDHLISIIMKYQEAIENEQYDDAQTLLDKWVQLYGKNEQTYSKQIKLLLSRQKYQEAIQLIAEAVKLYPIEPYFANLQHDVLLKVNKNPSGAIRYYEGFLDRNYNLNIAFALADDYIEQGAGNRAVDLYEKIDKSSTAGFSAIENLYNYYYNTQETKKAKVLIDKLLALSPFNGNYWESAAKLAERSDNKKEALADFQKALHYTPNNYDVRRQIRELQGKPDFASLLPQNNEFDLYKKSKPEGREGEHDWYYVLDERCAILYPERNSEIYSTTVIKILNEGGINYWKESSIGYDDSKQRLIIEKAEILKPNGSRVAAEQNGNQLVFPNLQVGDGLYLRYRLSNYAFGRMSREFWDTYFFNAFVPSDISRFILFTPPSMPVNFKSLHTDIQPVIKDLTDENLKQYTWELTNLDAIKDQRLMPEISDLGKMLQISTLNGWDAVAGWYSDVSDAQAKRDYDVQQLAKELFPAGNKMSETEKAKAIYNWIIKNIRYSSVPFRQSGYVPQRASKVIQTSLGDCKDLATLFAALAREAGMKANLVLVNTRDQGEHSMELPSMEFNHCIVKVTADGQIWYLELTDPDLPFGSLADGDLGAVALEIPFGDAKASGAKPFILDPSNRTLDKRQERTVVEIKGRDFQITTEAVRCGALTSHLRSNYKNLPQAKRVEDMQGTLAKYFTNQLTVKELYFGDLNEVKDTLHYTVRYNVKNEVAEIGQFTTFKIPFYDVVFNVNSFPEEERVHPVCFWKYEDSDRYEEEVIVKLPEGKTFQDIPKDVDLSFGDMKYNLKYAQKGPGEMQVLRTFTPGRKEVPAAEYDKMRAFVEEIVHAETRWITMK